MHPISRASVSWCLAAFVAPVLVAATPGCSNQESGSRADDASGDDDDTSNDDDDDTSDDDDDDDTSDDDDDDDDTSGDDDDDTSGDNHTGIDVFNLSWGQGTVDGLAATFDGTLTQSWQNQSDGTICSVTWAGADTIATAPSNPALCELDGRPCAFAFDLAFTGPVEDVGSDCGAFGLDLTDGSDVEISLGLVEDHPFGTYSTGAKAYPDILMYWVEGTATAGTGTGWYILYDSIAASTNYGYATTLEGQDLTFYLGAGYL